MRRATRAWGVLWLAGAVLAGGLLVASAGGIGITYGVSSSKGCLTPTFVGQKDVCFYVFSNTGASSGDTVVVNRAEDVVNSAAGPVASGNILPTLQLVLAPTPPAVGAPTCSGGSGAGTVASPYVGATSCTVPVGATVASIPAGFYTIKPADFAMPKSKLTDQVDFRWIDLCDATPDPGSCNPIDLNDVQAPSSTTLRQYKPTITTQLVPTTIFPGQSTHDTASITFDTVPPVVSGTVNYKLYVDSTCTTPSTSPTLDQNVTYTGGTVPSSSTIVFPHAGHYYFVATFSGDAAHGVAGPVTSGCAAEPLTITLPQPLLSTTATPSSATIPAALSDTAHLSNATVGAGGTITFRLYSDALCANEVPGSPVSKTVSGNGDYPSASITVEDAGTYFWRASYSGDSDNNPVPLIPCGAPSESAAVKPATPSLTTTATPSTAQAPAQLTDVAHLTGATANAGGTLTFHLYSDLSCAAEAPGSPVSRPVSGTGDYTSAAITVENAGSYAWRVAYSGDNNNDAIALTPCGANGEQATLQKADPALSTTASQPQGFPPVVLTDAANLSGATANAGGTITFHLYADAGCSAGSEVTGSPVTVTVHGAGFYTSPGLTVLNFGTYVWRASYNGDSNNNPIALTPCGDPNETAILQKPQPKLVTTASSHQTGLPASLTDTAVLSNAASNAAGAITFHLYSDPACTAEVAGSPRTVAVNGPGTYTSPAVTVHALGTYYWRDAYSGDANDLPVAPTPCGAAGESTTIGPVGQLELCKASDNGAAGVLFTFTAVNVATGDVLTTQIDGGHCTPQIDASPGRWQITEDLSSGLWSMVGATVIPSLAQVGENDAQGWVKVKVTVGAETQITFIDKQASATLKVCKYSSAPAFQGSQYAFTVGTVGVSAVAGLTKATAGCSNAVVVQPGSIIRVTEALPAGERVAGVSVSSNATLAATGKDWIVKVTVGAGANLVYFDNEPLPPT